MPDYKKNPIFNSEINKIQSHEPNIAFQYAWDNTSGKWVPAPKEIEVDVAVGDLTFEASDTITHDLLGDIQAVLESQGQSDDTTTHGLLSVFKIY